MWMCNKRYITYLLFLYLKFFILDTVVGNETFSGNISDSKQSEFNGSNGFSDHIIWHSLEESLSEAAKNDRPIMIIIYKTECGACNAFKQKFKDSVDILELSRYFNMVNVKQGDVKDSNLSPDGTYVPRVLFLDSRGNVHYEIFNKKGNPEYKYFYSNITHLLDSMKKAISMFVTLTASEEL